MWSLAQSLPLWGRSPSRGAHGAAAGCAALALPAPAWSCRRTRGGVTLGRRSSVAAARSFGALALGGSRSPRVVAGAVASSLGAVAVARRSRRRCLRRRAGAPGASLVVPPRSRRRDTRPPRPRGGGPFSQRSATGGSRSLRAVVGAVASSLGAVAVARRSRRRCLRRRAGAPGAGLVVPPRSRRRDARPPRSRGGDSLSLHVLGGSRSLRAVVRAVTSSLGAVAVARHSRRRYLRRRAGALGAGLVVPPRSWRRGAQPLRCRSGGSLRRALSRAITQVASRPRRLPLHPEENPSTRREAPALRTFAQRAAIPVWFSPLLEKEHAAP